MKKKTLIIIGISLVGLAGIFWVVMQLGGFFKGETFTIPPCKELPIFSKAQEALVSHNDVVEKLRTSGSGIEVSAVNPCGKDDRGVIKISFKTDAEKQSINAVLSKPTFGIPILLERR